MGTDSFERDVCDSMKRLYRFGVKSFGRTMSCEEIEDLTQETLIDALRTRSTFRGECQVFTWLGQIFRFKAITYLRKRAKTVSLDEMLQDASLEQDDTRIFEPSTDHTPEDELLCAEQEARVGAELDKLSSAHREAVRRVYYDDLSIDEAAAYIGIPAATVKTRLFYARKALEKQLAA